MQFLNLFKLSFSLSSIKLWCRSSFFNLPIGWNQGSIDFTNHWTKVMNWIPLKWLFFQKSEHWIDSKKGKVSYSSSFHAYFLYFKDTVFYLTFRFNLGEMCFWACCYLPLSSNESININVWLISLPVMSSIASHATWQHWK